MKVDSVEADVKVHGRSNTYHGIRYLAYKNTVPITMVRTLSGADGKYCFGQPMLTTLEWPVTLVLTMRIRVFGGQWAMVLRPFGPEWGRILQS